MDRSDDGPTVAGALAAWAHALDGRPDLADAAEELRSGSPWLLDAPLLAAVAGAGPVPPTSPTRPGADRPGPDEVDPALEILVADADATQSAVLAAAEAGGPVLVLGAPGTGKTQTAANLVVASAAAGRSVLFLTASRPGAAALVARLDRAGLAGLVAGLPPDGDLSGLTALGLPGRERPEDGSGDSLEQSLAARRAELAAHEASVHERREPWGISVHQARSRLGEIPAADRSALRLDDATLDRLDEDGYQAAADTLRSWLSLGGLRVATGGSPWSATYLEGRPGSEEAATTARRLVTVLATRTWPEASALLTTVAGACGADPFADLAWWDDALAVLVGMADLLVDFEPALLDLPLGDLAAELESVGPARRVLPGATARAAAGRLRACVRPGHHVERGRLREAAVTGARLGAEWRRLGLTTAVVPPPEARRAAVAVAQVRADLVQLARLTGIDLSGRPGPELTEGLSTLAGDGETLLRIPELTAARRRIVDDGLGPLLDEVVARGADGDGAVATLEWVWLSSVATRIAGDPRLTDFDASEADRAVEEYRRADRAHLSAAAGRVRRAVASHLVTVRDAQPIQARLVDRQGAALADLEQLRELWATAPDVLTATYPCWVLGPADVPMLPAGTCFDLVVVDDAGHLGPAESAGALARASQVVAFGDPVHPAAVGGGPSLLDALAPVATPQPIFTLPTHWRSRDERLVSYLFAQAEGYGGGPVTFPGVGPASPLRLVVAGAGVDAAVSAVADHAHQRPGRSLAVVTVGEGHDVAVRDAVAAARGTDPSLDDFLAGRSSLAAASEPFVVLDAASVHGEERDVVVVAADVAPGAWGPLEGQDGVALVVAATTRSRSATVVVSPVGADAIGDPGRLAPGPRLWSGYLARAAGRSPSRAPAERSGALERDIAVRLARAGIPVVASYGRSSRSLDLAAWHPTVPGRMVLAIETDGDGYHQSTTVRDRDRLRPEQLERLGWRYHRIWTSAWLRQRDHEVTRALRAYRLAVAAADASMDASGRPAATAPMGEPPAAVAVDRGPIPIRTGRDSIGEYRQEELVALVRWVRAGQIDPDHDRLRADTIAALGFRKAGRLIVAAVDAAVDAVEAAPGPAGSAPTRG